MSLIGMPGGGKSTVGRHLGRRLGLPFVDTDATIEDRIGRSIRSFFEHEGEERFREIEASVLRELVFEQAGVIATGGGVVLREANRQVLREHTVCVYLRSSPEELFRRLRHDSKRPLLQVADPLARLRDLYSTRDHLYCQTATFVVETGRPSVPALVNMILMQLELAGLVDPSAVPSPIDPPDGARQ
ncbi:MAG: shikimate kinase [Burkholderiales bacterium]